MKKVIIFGAGLGGERAKETLSENEKAICFADNDPNKIGSTFCGIPVIHPNDIKEHDFDLLLIASIYFREIYPQVLCLGVNKNEIEVFQEVRDAAWNPDHCEKNQTPVWKLNYAQALAEQYPPYLKRLGSGGWNINALQT